VEPAVLVPPQAAAAPAAVTERFQPGGVLHALVSGLLELALAAVLLAVSLLVGDSSASTATSLAAAAALWAVLAVYSLVIALLRARVHAAELDGEAVVLHGVGGARRLRYDELSAVEVSRNRTRLVARTGQAYTVRGVRGRAQGNRFRARVLARATEAAQRRRAAGNEPPEAPARAEEAASPPEEGAAPAPETPAPEDRPQDRSQPDEGPPSGGGDAGRLPGAEG
jgi:hypothetical protein